MTGAVLAGGKSLRMGREKGLVEIRGQSMIATMASILGTAQGIDSLIIVTNSPSRFSFLDMPMIPDYFPAKGPLAGIHAALRAVRDWIFVTACDMPFLSPELPRYLWNRRDGVDVVVPRIGGHWATVAALYGPGCLPELERALDYGSPGLVDVVNRLRVRSVSERDLFRSGIAPRSFFSVNTPDDVCRANGTALETIAAE